MLMQCYEASALYSRKRDSETSRSLTNERRELTNYAHAHGMNIVGEFLEPGITGRTTDRPQLLQMQNEALEPNSRFTTILIYSYSCLFRDADDAISWYVKLRRNGVRLVAVTQPLPPEPEFGMLMLQFIMTEGARLSKMLNKDARRDAISRGSKAAAMRLAAEKPDPEDAVVFEQPGLPSNRSNGAELKSRRIEPAVIYRRLATKRQGENGSSLEVQEHELKLFAAKNNLTVVEEYVESGSESKSTSRPQLLEMLVEALEPHPRFNVILVYSYSRLFRNADEATQYYYRLRQNGVRIVAMTQPLPAEPEYAILMLQFIFAEDARLSKKLSMHSYSWAYRRFKHGVICGPAAYGYCKDSQGKLQIVPEEAEIVVRLIKERAGELYTPDPTCSGRANRLNGEGKTYRGGTLWTASHVRSIESYFAYTGFFKALFADSGFEVDEHMILDIPAIVSRVLYEKAARRGPAAATTRLPSRKGASEAKS